VPDADDGAGGRLTWQTAGPFIATECVPWAAHFQMIALISTDSQGSTSIN